MNLENHENCENHDDLLREIVSEENLNLCQVNLETFSWIFLHDMFTKKFSQLHREMFSIIDRVYYDAVFGNTPGKLCIAAPRAIGKTSIALSLLARAIVFRHFRFILYVSNSYDSAEEQTEQLKDILTSNPVIKAVFGEIGAVDQEGMAERFSRKVWTALDTLVVPRGSGQQIRGRMHRGHRPDLIVVDDLEDTMTIHNEEMRLRRKKWFFADLMHCPALSHRNWMVLYIDTVKHPDSLINHLLVSPEWQGIQVDICNDNLESLAPEFISTEELRAEYERAKRDGLLDVFFMERRSRAIADSERKFHPGMWKYYSEPAFSDDLHKWESIVLVDPARRKGSKSARTAIVGVSLNMQRRLIRVRDVVNDSLDPDQQARMTVDMAVRIGAKMIGLETTGGDDYILYTFRNHMAGRGIHMDIIEMKSPGGAFNEGSKLKRIMSLHPLYNSGRIEHNDNGCCTVLEMQLMSLPNPKYWDVMDAFSRIVQFLEESRRYFYDEFVTDPVVFDEAFKRLVGEQESGEAEESFNYKLAI